MNDSRSNNLINQTTNINMFVIRKYVLEEAV